MEKPSKSRARGRARGRAQATEGGAPGPTRPVLQTKTSIPPAPSSPGPSRAHVRSGERPGGLQTRQIGTDTLPRAMGAMRLTGRITSDDNGDGNGNGNGNGNGGAPVGRGTTRGRREISQILCTRPTTVSVKAGSSGRALNLLSNYFVLEKNKQWRLCLYHVDFSPEEERTAMRKKLLRQHDRKIGEKYVFDGMQLWCSRFLPNGILELDSQNETTNEWFKIKVKFIKELHPFDIQFMQLLNIILNRCQDYLGLQLCGSNYYNIKKEERVAQHNISVWPGFTTSIRQFEKEIMLNLDVTHKFVRDETLLDVMNKSRRFCRSDKELNEKFIGCSVCTLYNNKIYRVDSIAFDLSPGSTFPYRGGTITYKDYYKKSYGIDIRVDRQPLACSKAKKKDLRRGMAEVIYLVPELCSMTGLSDEMRADFGLMKDLAKYMRMTPDQRVKALKEFNTCLRQSRQVMDELNYWGLNLHQELVQVQGRILPTEPILQGNRTVNYQDDKAEWSREIRSLTLNSTINLQNWACVFPSRFSSDANNLVSTLRRVAQPMGFNIGLPQMISMNSDTVTDYDRALLTCAGKQMVLLVLPNNNKNRYGAIKRKLSVDMAIPSQCILTKTLSKQQRLMSVATKVAIQMNCKLGGDVWQVQVPIKNVMMIGYDAYHDTQTRGASFGAVVSSINGQWTKYHGQVSKHRNKEELTNHFSTNVKQALEYYLEMNKCLPASVFVFRDGVGEGQVGFVQEHEVAAIKQCFRQVGNPDIKLAFVVVSKRINTRVFLPSQRGLANPPPGTVVDSIITLPERYDFYLIPQSVNQGTVTPSSYNVIHDTTGLKPDYMQRLTFKLTHLYYNWQGTIRVPAPCMYAHKLAYITGTAVHEHPHRNLASKLWYL